MMGAIPPFHVAAAQGKCLVPPSVIEDWTPRDAHAASYSSVQSGLHLVHGQCRDTSGEDVFEIIHVASILVRNVPGPAREVSVPV